jgi:hypothetical protein
VQRPVTSVRRRLALGLHPPRLRSDHSYNTSRHPQRAASGEPVTDGTGVSRRDSHARERGVKRLQDARKEKK